MAEKKLLQIILEKLNGYFTTLGMKKQKEDIYIQEIKENIFSSVGLNRAVKNKGNYVEINAVIGIRHQEIEKMVATLREQEFHEYSPPTISTPIGYITPQKTYSPIIFTPDTDIDNSIREFSKEFKKYAFNMFEENKKLDVLCDNLQKNIFFLPQQSEYRIAVCYFLLKEYDKAKEYMNKQLEKLKGRHDGLVDYMNTFSNNLFALIEKEQNPKPSP